MCLNADHEMSSFMKRFISDGIDFHIVAVLLISLGSLAFFFLMGTGGVGPPWFFLMGLAFTAVTGTLMVCTHVIDNRNDGAKRLIPYISVNVIGIAIVCALWAWAWRTIVAE